MKCAQMNKIKEWLSLTPIEDYVIPFVLLLCVFSTNNRLIILSRQLALLLTVMIVFFAFASRKRPAHFSGVRRLYLALFALIFLGFTHTRDVASCVNYAPYLLAAVFLVVFEFDSRFYSCLFAQFEVFFWTFIASMYLELLAPSLFDSVFSFLALEGNQSPSQVGSGAIAGLAYEKAYAAFLCNLGLGVLFAKLFCRGFSVCRLIEVLITFGALMMTGKRTLFLIPLMGIVLFSLVLSRNHRVALTLGVIFVLLVLLAVAYAFIPQIHLIFDRLFVETADPLSGREVFWAYALQMFLSSPLLGMGFLSFNEYVNAQGFTYYGGPWNYQAHNVYLQLLAELGIVGPLVFTLLMITLLVGLIRAYRRMSVESKSAAVYCVVTAYWTVLFAIYSLTGNTLYYACQLMILPLCVGVYQLCFKADEG